MNGGSKIKKDRWGASLRARTENDGARVCDPQRLRPAGRVQKTDDVLKYGSAAAHRAALREKDAGQPRPARIGFPHETNWVKTFAANLVLSNITIMLLHRIIRLVCLIGASIAPILSAQLCHFVSRIAVKHLIPNSDSEHLPVLTQTWIVGVANSNFPLIFIALIFSSLVGVSGLYIIFSKRFSANSASSAILVICCVGYTAALLMVASAMLALVMPFLPIVSK